MIWNKTNWECAKLDQIVVLSNKTLVKNISWIVYHIKLLWYEMERNENVQNLIK